MNEVKQLVNDNDQEIKAEALRYILQHAPAEWQAEVMEVYLQHEDYMIQGAALMCAARESKNNDELKYIFKIKERVEDALNPDQPIENEERDKFTKINCAKAIGVANIPELYPYLHLLLKDADQEIRKAAIISAGQTANKEFIPILCRNLVEGEMYSTARKAETIQTVLDRLRGTANVKSAGFARHGVLITEELSLGTFVPQGRMLDDVRSVRPRVRSVSDGYLTAMGVPVLSGRELDANDTATAPPVIVINQAAARRYFGDANPVGQVIDWHLDKTPVQVTVAGVVDNVRQKAVGEEAYPEIFVDYRQLLFLMDGWPDLKPRQDEWAIGFLSFAIRTDGDPVMAVPTVRRLVSGVDPNIGIDAILPMNRLVASSLARQRFYAVLLGVFAGVAGLLAAIGVYGVLAYMVVQRRHEIGVRMALGAERRQVIALVLRQGLVLTMAGVSIGLVVAAAGARSLQSLLFGIQAVDLQTFAVVGLAFALVALLASYLPARRATRVDPMVALRVD